jgi:hypothetical protein
MAPKYTHPDGENSPQFIGAYREFKVRVDDDGTYETDVDPDVLREHGFLADDTDGAEPVGWDGVPDDLDALTHGQLKDVANDVGIADEIDLRSKSSIREALEEHSGAE